MRFCLLVLAGFGMSGCALGLGDPTNTSFATPTVTGFLDEVDRGARGGSDFSDETGNGYGYQVGAVDEDGLQGFAGLVPGASVTAAPTSGAAVMTGQFELAAIKYIITNGTSVSGQSFLDRGDVSLNVDFANGRVTGGGTGLDGGLVNIALDNNELIVDGRFTGDRMTGTVTYDGVSGSLEGLAGSDEVIGSFHGHTDSALFAGGFIAN